MHIIHQAGSSGPNALESHFMCVCRYSYGIQYYNFTSGAMNVTAWSSPLAHSHARQLHVDRLRCAC